MNTTDRNLDITVSISCALISIAIVVIIAGLLPAMAASAGWLAVLPASCGVLALIGAVFSIRWAVESIR